MKRVNKILIGLILIGTMFLSIGYSAIENITLDIKGIVTASQTTFPYIPTGFIPVEGTTLDTGLTIQDGSGNQYVWVEVPKTEGETGVYKTAGINIDLDSLTGEELTEAYTTIENDLKTYTTTYKSGTYSDTYYSDATTGLTSTQYTELKQKMLKSVYQNGGFYVGRYEVGTEEIYRTELSLGSITDTPVIKANAYPYTWVTCSEAQTLANNMASGEYTTSLMFGLQWDLMLKYLEKKGTSISSLITNSRTWGNYKDNSWNITNVNSKYSTDSGALWTLGAYGEKNASTNILLSTGADDSFSKQNIYDIAGNVYEWTLEYTSKTSDPCVYRGGSFHTYGGDTYACVRLNYRTSTSVNNIGFRVVIY